MQPDPFRQVIPVPAHPKRAGLWRLIQFLIEAARKKAWMKITIQIRDGQIKIVHVEQTFELDTLPVEDTGAGLAIEP